ncbi:MAG: carbohydrate ABC transporter permease [Clostridia bacterium]|nr:carbohydrate ABC transporter permease [Clostridia bacterium]MBR2287256.1 carbohydrate ABC transporter permease [Clostridia bacterium]
MKQTSHIGGTRAQVWKVLKMVIAIIMLIIYLFPFALVLVNSLKTKVTIVKHPLQLVDDKGLQWQNYQNAIDQMHFGRSFFNSLFVVGISVILLMLFASMAAWLFVRTDWAACKISFSLMLASMIVPFQVVMIPLISIYGAQFHMLNHRMTMVFMNLGFGVSMCTFMCHGFIKGNIPVALEEAARIDGAGYHRTFFTIVLPLLKPILSTVAILEILSYWNDYLLPSMVFTRKEFYTLPLAIRTFYGEFSSDYGNIMAGLTLSVAPVILVYLILQKHVIGGIVAGAVK